MKVCNYVPQAVQNGVVTMSTSGLSGFFNSDVMTNCTFNIAITNCSSNMVAKRRRLIIEDNSD